MSGLYNREPEVDPPTAARCQHGYGAEGCTYPARPNAAREIPLAAWIHVGECPCEDCRRKRIRELVEQERDVLERLADDD